MIHRSMMGFIMGSLLVMSSLWASAEHRGAEPVHQTNTMTWNASTDNVGVTGGPSIYWYNFRTHAYDLRGAPTADEEARQYIDQGETAQQLYRRYREQGYEILDAMAHTFDAVIDAYERQQRSHMGR